MQRISNVVILGGGTSGWLSAAILASQLKDTEITLVESEQIGTIGVGEATIPPFISTLKSLGIDEADFIKKTRSSFKLGIQFTDWLKPGHRYFHPFGQIGQPVEGHEFYSCWLSNPQRQYMDYSPCFQMATANRFFVPENAKGTPLEAAAYALHIDAGLAAQYFRKYCRGRRC